MNSYRHMPSTPKSRIRRGTRQHEYIICGKSRGEWDIVGLEMYENVVIFKNLGQILIFVKCG